MIVRPLGAALACAALLSGAALAADATLPQVAAKGRTPFVAVFVWHDVLPQKEVWFDTTSAEFESELVRLKSGGFHPVTLERLHAHLVTGAPLPSKAVALTFDDNGYGIFANAFPLLRKYGFPTTLFVHTNYVGKTTSKRHSSWADLRAMERSGLVVVQSQTANHPEDLRALSDADIVHELTLSRFSIEHRLGHGVDALAYPYDNYDERVMRLAAANGYVLGFTEDHGGAGASDSLLAVHRYSLVKSGLFDEALAAEAR
jgi:peptidoglycan/xylan/chitin deacetylase (PgdA/CDA1 family)